MMPESVERILGSEARIGSIAASDSIRKYQKPMDPSPSDNHPRAHRRACLKIVLGLLLVWFFVSFGCGILFREWLDTNAPQIGSAPFGFWMAQQGSIICFVLLLITYAFLMNRLDARHGYSEHHNHSK